MPVQGRTALPFFGSARPILLLAGFLSFMGLAWAGSPVPQTLGNSTPNRGTFNVVPSLRVEKPAVPQTVDINSATAESLDAVLLGVGPAKARAIVAYRSKYGAFRRVEELLEVKGIGKSLLEKNRDRIVLH